MTSIAATLRGTSPIVHQYPFDGIDDIRFAAAIEPDDAYFLLRNRKSTGSAMIVSVTLANLILV